MITTETISDGPGGCWQEDVHRTDWEHSNERNEAMKKFHHFYLFRCSKKKKPEGNPH